MSLSGSPQISLDKVLITDQLRQRPARKPDSTVLDRALLHLARELSVSPHEAMQRLAETAMSLSRAHTAGVSIEEGEVFRWHGMAGRFAAAIGATMQRRNSPCGVVLDRNEGQLMARPELYYPFPGPIDPPIVEVLLTPFFTGGRAVGTIWVIAHDDERKFDGEDLRILNELAGFASSAYALLTSLGYVQGRTGLSRHGLN